MTSVLKNQYPTEGKSSIDNETLDEIVMSKKLKTKSLKNEQHLKTIECFTKIELQPRFFVQYIGNICQNFVSTLNKLCDIQITFTTRKLRTSLLTLRSFLIRI